MAVPTKLAGGIVLEERQVLSALNIPCLLSIKFQIAPLLGYRWLTDVAIIASEYFPLMCDCTVTWIQTADICGDNRK